jgi:hypothetical protein
MKTMLGIHVNLVELSDRVDSSEIAPGANTGTNDM